MLGAVVPVLVFLPLSCAELGAGERFGGRLRPAELEVVASEAERSGGSPQALSTGVEVAGGAVGG